MKEINALNSNSEFNGCVSIDCRKKINEVEKEISKKKKNLITIASIFLKKQNQTINTAKRKTKVFLLKQLSPIKRSQAGNENNVLNVTEFCMTM